MIIPLWLTSLVYWCINKQAGSLILLCEGFSVVVNQLIKNTFCIFRPWIIDPRVKPAQIAIYAAGGYSFPSGHTTIAVACWGAMARFWRKNKILMIFLSTLCLLVAFSRNYLGVHTLQDVLVAIILTVLLIFGVEYLLKWVENGKNRDILLTCWTTLICYAIIVYVFSKGYPHPEIVNPYGAKLETLQKTGFLLGAIWGWLLERRFVNFDPTNGSVISKVIRFFNGGIILYGLVSFTCGWFIKIAGLHNGLLLHFVITGLFVTFVYPLFIKFAYK